MGDMIIRSLPPSGIRAPEALQNPVRVDGRVTLRADPNAVDRTAVRAMWLCQVGQGRRGKEYI